MQQGIFEGKTTTEAIEKGLKELKVTKDKVDIRVLENEDKRSFFSILTPRVVKVELTLKEERKEEKKEKNFKIESKDLEKAKQNIENFLGKWRETLPVKPQTMEVVMKENYLMVSINGEDLNYLIGYRGEVLNYLQTLLTAIASKGIEEKARVILNICGYKEKREKSLEDLAEKIARTVVRTQKAVTLEPMNAYERKVIHSKLQEHDKVKTESVGEEPYRKVVISLK